jgi:hypothetical protein
MRKGLLGTIAALAASAGLAYAQPPAPAPAPNAGPAIAAPAGPGGLPMAQGPLPYMDGPGADPGLLSGLGTSNGLSSEKGWASFNYILWWMRTMPAQPLITAGTAAAGGVNPNIGTTILFGAQNFNINPLSGMEWETGYWWKKNPLWGVSLGGFVTEQNSDSFRIMPNQQVVARPFIDADTGLPNSFLVSFPGFLTGDITARVRGQIWGLDLDIHRKLLSDETRRLTVRAGFRYIDLNEDLSVSSQSTVLPGNTTTFYNLIVGPGSRIDVNDRFNTRNQYMLGDLGFQGDWRYRRWLFEWSTKIGIGAVHEALDIEGNSKLVTTPGAPFNTVQGGLLALDSNIGRFFSGRFAVVPEGKLQVTYRMCGCIDLGMGYTFTYFSRVIRPSDQIDPMLSTTRIPTSANFAFPIGAFRPVVLMNQSDMWVQGVNFTVSFHF